MVGNEDILGFLTFGRNVPKYGKKRRKSVQTSRNNGQQVEKVFKKVIKKTVKKSYFLPKSYQTWQKVETVSKQVIKRSKSHTFSSKKQKNEQQVEQGPRLDVSALTTTLMVLYVVPIHGRSILHGRSLLMSCNGS